MSLVPVEGAPGLLRDTLTGRLVNQGQLRPFETSDRFEGLEFARSLTGFLRGWRFTCAKWPTPQEMQQLVQLRDESLRPELQVVSEVTLASILSLPGDPASRDHKGMDIVSPGGTSVGGPLRVQLLERPVEGVGLRVHFFGLATRM